MYKALTMREASDKSRQFPLKLPKKVTRRIAKEKLSPDYETEYTEESYWTDATVSQQAKEDKVPNTQAAKP